MSAGPPATPHSRVFQEGEYLMREGERGTIAYIIQDGQVMVFFERMGRRCQLATLGPNEVVGEMALIDNLPRSASVVALERTVASPIDLGKLREIIRSQPDLAFMLIRVLVKKIRDADRLLDRVYRAKTTL